MTASQPLTGIELIDCAKANAKQGLETAAELCGYGANLAGFQEELQQACRHIGVKIDELSDLITEPPALIQRTGIEFAPDSESDL